METPTSLVADAAGGGGSRSRAARGPNPAVDQLARLERGHDNSGLDSVRRDVVGSRVELYELQSDAADKPQWETPPPAARYLGLHGWVYVIGGRLEFLGSVNLDPRSRSINTEMMVAATDLAERANAAIGRLM